MNLTFTDVCEQAHLLQELDGLSKMRPDLLFPLSWRGIEIESLVEHMHLPAQMFMQILQPKDI